MRLTITFISTNQLLQLEVPSDISINDLKALIASEIPAIAAFSQHLYHNGRLLSDSDKTLKDYNIGDEDLLVLHAKGGNSSGSGTPSSQSAVRRSQATPVAGSSRGSPYGQRPPDRQDVPGEPGNRGSDSEMIRLQVLGDPRLMNELQNSQPELANAVNDPEKFRTVFQLMEQRRADSERQKQREIQMLNDDPFNIEAQQKIEDLIRQEAVMENLQSALEHNPEAFGRVNMLYIPVEVNGTKVKAFVDSGAQATIMSPSCAETCGIMRLVDVRFAGIARGVGTAKILGRVHSAQIKIGRLFLACSFTVMEGKDVDLLLGLDMLKRHQAILDFKKGCLTIQDEEVGFLGESEIPKREEEMRENEPVVEGPGGAKVGARTGAFIEPSIQQTPAAGMGGGEVGGQPQPGQQQQQQQEQRFSEENIGQLEALGFSRADAQAALVATGGDVDMAASLLFQ